MALQRPVSPSPALYSPTNTQRMIISFEPGVTYALWDPADQAANQITVMKFNGRESTPSKLAFDADGQVLWGHAAQDVATGYTWSKVLLDPQQNHGGYRGRLLSHLVEDGFLRLDPRHNRQRVIGQFLRCLRDEVVTKLKLLYPEKPPVEWWFSIPAVWGEQPRHRMLQVVTAAGYKSDPRDAVFLISEAEAAAIATLYRIPRFQVGLPGSCSPSYFLWLALTPGFHVADPTTLETSLLGSSGFWFVIAEAEPPYVTLFTTSTFTVRQVRLTLFQDVTVLSVQDRGSGPQYTQITASTGMETPLVSRDSHWATKALARDPQWWCGSRLSATQTTRGQAGRGVHHCNARP